MNVEVTDPVTEAEKELAAIATGAGRIIVGVDDSPGGRTALRLAVAQARTSRAQLVAVRSWARGLPRHGGLRRRRLGPVHPHIVLHWDRTTHSERSKDFVRRCLADTLGSMPEDVAVAIRTPEGEPAAVLTNIAKAEGDVIVVGQARQLTVRRALHGSIGLYCRKHARCPVVIVPPRSPMPMPGRHDRGPTLTSVDQT